MRHLRVLLVDEVSMLSGEFLDLLDAALRKLVSRFGNVVSKARGEACLFATASRWSHLHFDGRCNPPPASAAKKLSKNEAFGGIQLICCGDFFQLPPILGCVPSQTWPRLDPAALKQHRALLSSGQEDHQEELFLNRGFAFQVHLPVNRQ